MPKLSRVELHKSAEIPASADEVWKVVSDWAGMLRWWLTCEQGGLFGPALVKCDLIGEDDAVSLTRRMTLENCAVIDELLFYQNDETRRIYYIRSEPTGSEVTGYVATTYVDVNDGDDCTLHVSSRFDVGPGADLPAVIARFEAIYEAIFSGYKKYFSSAVAG